MSAPQADDFAPLRSIVHAAEMLELGASVPYVKFDHKLLARLLREYAERSEDAARLDFFGASRAALLERPYTLTVHFHAFETLRQYIDKQMEYAARATPAPGEDNG